MSRDIPGALHAELNGKIADANARIDATDAEILRSTLPLAMEQGVRFDGGWGSFTNPKHLAAIQSGKPFTMTWVGAVEKLITSGWANLFGSTRRNFSYPSNTLGLMASDGGSYGFQIIDNNGNRSEVSFSPTPEISGSIQVLSVGVDTDNGQIHCYLDGKNIASRGFNPAAYDWSLFTIPLKLHASTGGNGFVHPSERVFGTTLFAHVHNYLIPATTTDGIPSWQDRYKSRQFVVPGLDDGKTTNNVFTGDSSEFESGTGDWKTTSPSTTTLTSSDEQAFSGERSLKVEMVDAPHSGAPLQFGGTDLASIVSGTGFSGSEGQFVEVTLWLWLPGIGEQFRLQIKDSNENVIPVAQRGFADAGKLNQWQLLRAVSFNGIHMSSSSWALEVVRIAGGQSEFFIDKVTVKNNGAVINATPAGIQNERGQWLDSSPNKAHLQLSESGAKPIIPVSRWTYPATTSTNGSVWAGGSDRMVLENDHTIEQVYVTSAAGGETVQVGSTAGGSDIVASVVLTAGLNVLTLARGNSPTNKLSITSNSTNELEWSFKGGNLNF